jgi:tight adherence protein B
VTPLIGTAAVLLGTACGLSLAAPAKTPARRLHPIGASLGGNRNGLVATVRSRLRRQFGAGRDERAELVALTERLAALSRAGVAPQRAWQVLAAAGGAGTGTAGVVVGMLAGGGTVAAGLRLAARRQSSSSRLRWLAAAYEVAERSGTPASALLERFAELVRAELGREQDRAVALAGPRATASLLSCLPLAAPALGWLIGADPWHALVGTAVGRCCLGLGLGCWLAGRAWTGRLVDRTRQAGR